eukprot:m.355309 g.355309  ORF g.355309 m.355309 type:complete len:59 (+) comp78280_c0_seq1:25-201(+)
MSALQLLLLLVCVFIATLSPNVEAVGSFKIQGRAIQTHEVSCPHGNHYVLTMLAGSYV